MIKLKLILFVVFQLLQISLTYGQIRVTQNNYAKAVDLANYKYVVYSMSKVEEREDFIEKCDCEKDPNFVSIQNAISKTKTKTIAFSNVFDKLKDLNIELDQINIAIFLTDSIFDKNFNTEFERVFNFGNSRKEDQEFIRYKNDLAALISSRLNVHAMAQKNEEIDESVTANPEPGQAVVYEQIEPDWMDKMDILSITISILLSLFIIGFLNLIYFKNTVSKAIQNYVHKKVSGSYFDKRFDENQSIIQSLRKELKDLKEQIKELEISIKE